MKYSIILVVLLLGLPLMTAIIEDTQANIKIYSTTQVPKNGTVDNWKSLILRIEFTENTYSGNTQNYTVVIYPNTTVNSDEDFTLLFIKNESVDISTVAQLLTCLKDKNDCEVTLGKWDMSWNLCNSELEKYKGENATTYKENFDECSLSLKEKDLDLGAKDDKILGLEEEEKETKNSKYIWGFVGLVIGGAALYFYERRGGSPKEKAMSEFQRSQAR